MKLSFDYHVVLLLLVLFIPLGLTMDLVHEVGHGVWGMVAGGRLTYLKVAYFEIYPKPALTSTFVLGYAYVTGLGTDFAHGLMSLGGSMTTNIVSWVIALVLQKVRFSQYAQITLKTLGLFGVFDLPFYVVFPQVGLQHWIFIGGSEPEPLLGARKMGIPDAAFYLMVVSTTLGLLFLYFKSSLSPAVNRVRTVISGHVKVPSQESFSV